MIRYRRRTCVIKRRRKYTIRIGKKKRIIPRFLRGVRIRLLGRRRKIKRFRRKWRVRIKRRWCRLKKRGRNWYLRRRGRLIKIKKRIRLTCRIKGKTRRVKYKRGRWSVRVGRYFRGIKRRVTRYFRYGKRRILVRRSKRRKGYRVIGRKGKLGKLRRYKIKIYRARRRREYS